MGDEPALEEAPKRLPPRETDEAKALRRRASVQTLGSELDFEEIEMLNGLIDPKSPEKLAELGGVEALAGRLNSDLKMGLDEAAVEENTRKYGENKLPEPEFKTLWTLIVEALSDRTLIMLCIAAAISLAVGMATEGVESGWKDGVAVLVAVAIIVAITAGNDYSKERQFRKLNERKNDHPVNVIRGGHVTTISVLKLVVGDILQVDTGDIIPADGIFIKGNAGRCDESAATGESNAVKKGAAPDRDPCFLSGTLMIEGDARVLVTSVGAESFNGRILLALREPAPDTPLQEKLGKLANIIGNFALIAASFIFLAQVIKYFAIQGSDVDGDDALDNVVDFLVIAITIVVVAVPEGLPLAVTIALAYSMQSMMKDNNLVRHLDACETMGGATTICSDKTGTLTQNRMTVVQGTVAGKSFDDPEGLTLDKSTQEKLVEGIAVNSTAFETLVEGTKEFVGSRTECALLQFAQKLGGDYEALREQCDLIEKFPFSSKKKRMSTLIRSRAGDEKILHVKGASEVVLGLCTQYINEQGDIVDLDEGHRAELVARIEKMATDALRTLSLAYSARGLDAPDSDWAEDDAPNLVLVAIVGIMDPVRPEVPDAVACCKDAGVIVRMVTGDNATTARNIAKACGIFEEGEGHICMEGPKLRAMEPAALRAILPKLRVLARSSPTDKLKLVGALQDIGQVVAVTGDGVNDGPALKKADVGFSMGITGTEVAKEASAIVLLDDNFASIVNAIKWGRNVFDSIRKFLQFQMTVNFSAIIFLFVTLMADPDGNAESAPLKPVQLLWINLIMDTLAAVALATEPPSAGLLKHKPYDRSEPLMTPYMVRRTIVQVLCQVATFLIVLYALEDLFDSNPGPDHDSDEDGQFSRTHLTIIFNIFVLSSMVNQINSRKLRRRFNVFAGIWKHKLFISVWVISLIVQALMVEFGGDFVQTEGLTGGQWGGCLLIALFPLVWTFLFNLLPESYTGKSLYIFGRLAVASAEDRHRWHLDQLAEHAAAGAAADGADSDVAAPQEVVVTDLDTMHNESSSDVMYGPRPAGNGQRTPRELWGHAVWGVLAQSDVVNMFRRKHR
eukprot:m.70822 g.70822  ORF g.70822 m.70822 type:complete len:1076 (-) comp14099_c1_seq1:169-3396(-)